MPSMGHDRIGQILLTGGSGLIGRALRQRMQSLGMTYLRAVRTLSRTSSPSEVLWNPEQRQPFPTPGLLDGTDVAIHLSGENLLGERWSPSFMKRIESSRIDSTLRLATKLSQLKRRPKLLLSASAVGIYGDRGDDVLTEDSPVGSGYLSELCQAWEAATDPAQQAGIRVVHLRIGVVLDTKDGALKASLPLFRAGCGGRLGTGKQWMSWIAIDDLVSAILHLAGDDSEIGRRLEGPVNLTSPSPVRNADYTQALAAVLHRPALLPVPRIALRVALGDVVDAAILPSCRALPARLLQAGFHFSFSELPTALTSLLAK
jgi:uncharacterized protein (TIGR01777 family)